MISPRIYKRDSAGGLRTWMFEVDGPKWRTIAGGLGRKDVPSGWVACKGKQGRNDDQQAEFEATAALTAKLNREYRSSEAELASVPDGVMLAKSYEPGKITFPVFSQPKLDGARALISRHGAFSRDYQRWLNCDHILQALAPVFVDYPDIVFDGEFYNHDLHDDFGKIMSIARKQKPTDAHRAEARELLQYHVYDVADSSLVFADRNKLMFQTIFGERTMPSIVPVVTHEVTGHDMLDQHYADYMEQGYEGQMVRLNLPYEPDKRSKSLLKRKEFHTAEFKLLRVEEGQGNWAGYAKRVVFALADGRECGAGVRGSQGEMKVLLRVVPIDISTVTIRHFALTPDGVPRFPVAVDFHLLGRKD